MSAIFKVAYKGQDFDIEIARDGKLLFLNYDLEYDLALCEFGEDKTTAVKLAAAWIEDPLDVIVQFIKFLNHDRVLFAADCAEHVLWIFEKRRPGEERPRQAIDAVRNYINGKIDHSTFQEHKKAIEEVWLITKHAVGAAAKRSVESAVDVARAASSAYEVMDKSTWAQWGINEAHYAAAYYASHDNYSPEWKLARDAEKSWQVRRFVDVMEAIQAGKDWPDLKDTK